MPKRSISPNLSLGQPIAGESSRRWLYREIRLAILANKLQAGDRLPASRVLASQERIARSTVVEVYGQLAVEGYLESVHGSSTRVSAGVKLDTVKNVRSSKPAVVSAREVASKKWSPFFPKRSLQPAHPFQASRPALQELPLSTWARTVSRSIRLATPRDLMLTDCMGHSGLRRVLATHLRETRGLDCDPSQIMVTSGIQHALDLICRLVLNKGSKVLVEDPGYLTARGLMLFQGLETIPIAVDECGIRIASAVHLEAGLAVVTPAHQFPTGAIMSAERRAQMLNWASAAQALVFENDYDGEFRFEGKPLSPLKAIDRDDRVIYAGSFSKVLFPGIRLGYMVVPGRLAHEIGCLREFSDRHSPSLDQIAMFRFIEDGYLGQHLRRMTAVYRARREAMVTAIKQIVGEWLEITPAPAGLQLFARLMMPYRDTDVALSAAKKQLELDPVSRYCIKSKLNGFLLGFASHSVADIWSATHRLGRLLSGTRERKSWRILESLN